MIGEYSMDKKTLHELFDYAVKIRRELHQYPEVGFKLDRTVKLVSKELLNSGIDYTYKYGRSSIVAEIGTGEKIIALRADMDALPVEEKTGLEYSSRIPGHMHACGHDAHTAILLTVAKYLKSKENELPCKVRFIFQPSEEGAISGAKMMVDNGVMDGVDYILCAHCDNSLDAGKIGVCSGNCMSACVPVTIRFTGKASHAAQPELGIDANAMAVEAYQSMNKMVKIEGKDIPYIWSVGRISGGQVHNVISDLCEMDISFRFYDLDFSTIVEKNVKEICNKVAEGYGGKCEIIWEMSTGPVINNKDIVEQFKNIISNENIDFQEIEKRMTSEDFGWYLTKTQGMMFRFGTRNEEMGCSSSLHNSDFMIDEYGMKTAMVAFCSCVMNTFK